MKVVWSARAIRHLTTLRAYIAKDSERGAATTARKILDAIALLATQPALGRAGRLPGTRELVVPGTQYIVPYRVRGEQLELLAVFHGRQKWPNKL